MQAAGNGEAGLRRGDEQLWRIVAAVLALGALG